MDKSKIAFVVFVLVCSLQISGIILKIPSLIQIFKPFILISLLTLYVITSPLKNKRYIYALIFSFFGDVLLMFTGETYFIAGLISFLIAHILFIRIVIARISETTIGAIIFAAFPFVIVFGLLIFSLLDVLNDMLLPVIIYGVVITTFGTVSLIALLQNKSEMASYMFLGAVIFIISDATLAINKFYLPLHFFEITIMITYVFAQFLIFKSMVLAQKNFI